MTVLRELSCQKSDPDEGCPVPAPVGSCPAIVTEPPSRTAASCVVPPVLPLPSCADTVFSCVSGLSGDVFPPCTPVWIG